MGRRRKKNLLARNKACRAFVMPVRDGDLRIERSARSTPRVRDLFRRVVILGLGSHRMESCWWSSVLGSLIIYMDCIKSLHALSSDFRRRSVDALHVMEQNHPRRLSQPWPTPIA